MAKQEKLSQADIDKLLENLHEPDEGVEIIDSAIMRCIHCGYQIFYSVTDDKKGEPDNSIGMINSYAATPNSFKRRCASATGHFFKVTDEDTSEENERLLAKYRS
jgi:hypothetical protein